MEPAKPSPLVPGQWISEGTNDVRVKGRIVPTFYHHAGGLNMVTETVMAIILGNFLSLGAVMPFLDCQYLVSPRSASPHA
jgi:hypothetical protein